MKTNEERERELKKKRRIRESELVLENKERNIAERHKMKEKGREYDKYSLNKEREKNNYSFSLLFTIEGEKIFYILRKKVNINNMKIPNIHDIHN